MLLGSSGRKEAGASKGFLRGGRGTTEATSETLKFLTARSMSGSFFSRRIPTAYDSISGRGHVRFLILTGYFPENL
jgi:hypothetical protein